MQFKYIVRLIGFGCLWLLLIGGKLAQGQSGLDRTIKWTAEFQLVEGKRTGKIRLKAQIAEHHYIYSLTQKKIPPPTKLKIEDSKQFSITGAFRPNRKPTVIEHDEIFDNRIEKHYGTVVFEAPIKIEESANITNLTIPILVSGQVCSEETCTPFKNKRTVARFGGYYKPKQKK